MVSRIDIGPDGGPYVAINENSNDLELQDINGNVIAKWDETAGQWDFNINSLTGIDAINASSANLESLSTEHTDTVTIDVQNGLIAGEELGDDEGQKDTLSVTGIDDQDYRQIQILFEQLFVPSSPGEAVLTFNGVDADGNARYGYEDNSGTQFASTDNYRIVSVSDDSILSGTLTATYAKQTSNICSIQSNLGNTTSIDRTESLPLVGVFAGDGASEGDFIQSVTVTGLSASDFSKMTVYGVR